MRSTSKRSPCWGVVAWEPAGCDDEGPWGADGSGPSARALVAVASERSERTKQILLLILTSVISFHFRRGAFAARAPSRAPLRAPEPQPGPRARPALPA